MTHIYRVEYPDGRGPYNTGSASWELQKAILAAHGWNDNGSHPTVTFQMSRDGTHLCGFRRMQDLFRWFGGWLPWLIADGARVCTYDVHPDYVSDWPGPQVIFERRAAIA